MVLSLLDLSSNSRTIGFCVNTFVRNEFFPNLSTFQTFFSFRVGRLKFCTSWPLHGHYSFCIVYGRVVYHSFIKHDTQKLRYIINFNVINVFSIYTICCFTQLKYLFWVHSQKHAFRSILAQGLSLPSSVCVFWQILCVPISCCF